MRQLALIVALMMLTAPASAQGIADQAERAYSIFASGQSQPEFLLSKHGGKVLESIAGKWARLSGPNPQTGVESYGGDTEKICATPSAVTIATQAPLTADFINTVAGGSFAQTYTYVAGATFSEHTDLTAYLSALGLGPDKVGRQVEQQRVTALSVVNGLVQIYRPSPDIIVLTRDRGYPLILARCPA